VSNVAIVVAVAIVLFLIEGVASAWLFIVGVNRALTMGRLEILRNPPKPGALITMNEWTQKILAIKDFKEFRVEYPRERADSDETFPVASPGRQYPLESEMSAFVTGWPNADNEKQITYCKRHGKSAATYRNWRDELKRHGKLNS